MKRGYVALTTVLITMAVIMAITTTVTLLSIGAAQGSVALNKGEAAWNFTEGCMELALMKTRDSVAYDDGTETTPVGSCTIVVDKVGTAWILTATPVGTAEYLKKIEVQITRLGTGITVNSWKEV